jgi:hypothetical protein
MEHQRNKASGGSRVAEWTLPSSATLGSSVRATGIERELRRRMPAGARKAVSVANGIVELRMPETAAGEFEVASEKINGILEEVGQLPVLPREAEDILSISSRERHKWMKDGRLRSAGTRTVKMRGRSKAVTFHIFDPRHIEDVLDGDLPAIWRDDDAQAVAESRRRAAGKAALKRAEKARSKNVEPVNEEDAAQTRLEGWDAFAADGLLR